MKTKIEQLNKTLLSNSKEAERLLFYYTDYKKDLKSKLEQINDIENQLYDSYKLMEDILSWLLSDIELIITDNEDYDKDYLDETLNYANNLSNCIDEIKDYAEDYKNITNSFVQFDFDFTEEDKLIDFIFELKVKYNNSEYYWSADIYKNNIEDIIKDIKEYFNN